MKKILLSVLLLSVATQLFAGTLSGEMEEFAMRHRDHFRSLQSEKDPDYNHTMAFIQAYMSHRDEVREEGIRYMKELMHFYSNNENYKLLTKEARHIVDFVRKHAALD